MLTLAARRAAWYQGLPGHSGILNRWRRTIATEVWRRAARMLRACLPGHMAGAEYLLGGEMPGGTGADAGDVFK